MINANFLANFIKPPDNNDNNMVEIMPGLVTRDLLPTALWDTPEWLCSVPDVTTREVFGIPQKDVQSVHALVVLWMTCHNT